MGVNSSEERLAEQSRQTFLSLWAYQNPFYERGKELCDLLVVFGDDVIIMSDKVVGYNVNGPRDVAWGRWHTRAIVESVSQLRGALKTIKNRPDSIYLDAKASSPFPLRLPARPRFHLVAIAHGSEEACEMAKGVPSLLIDSRPEQSNEPFKVRTFFDGLFVHVFNRTALDALFRCFDTTADLVHYLNAKQKTFSAGDGRWVDGEENLIAFYLRTRSPNGQRGFDGLNEAVSDEPVVSADEWSKLCASDAFLCRRERLAPSYLIDQVIEQVASDYYDQAFVVGKDIELAQHAEAFSTLASEPRMARMLIGDALSEVLVESPQTFWSIAVESPEHPDVLYVWLIYPRIPDEVTDEELEIAISRELNKYVFVAMAKFPRMMKFFGISLPNSACARKSRFFSFAVRRVWTADMQLEAEGLALREGIFNNIESTRRVARGSY